MNTMHSHIPWYLIALAALVSACGGGGGGDNGVQGPGAGPGPTPTSRTISIDAPQSVDEGSSGGTTSVEFTVSLDSPATSGVSFGYSIQHTTTEASDFVTTSGTATIAAGASSTTVSIGAVADTAFELDEDFTLVLSNPSSNAIIGTGEAAGTLVNDDDLTVILDVFYLGNFDANLGGRALELDYDLLIDLADFLNGLSVTELLIPYDIYYKSDVHLPFFVASGNLRISLAAGSTGRLQVLVPPGFDAGAIGGNFVVEFDWSAVFSVPTATWDFVATVEAQDIEANATVLHVGDVSLLDEGDSGSTTDMTFVASLSRPLTTDVELSYETIDGTATAPSDYTGTSGSVTIPAGDTTASFSVTVNGDDEAEGTTPEVFVVVLQSAGDAVILGYPWATGSIFDDDTVADNRRVAVQNSQLVEGDSGTSDMEFDITLNGPAVTLITVRYATRDDTATAGTDYEVAAGELTFQPGESQLVIAVPIIGDTDPEDDERFFVDITDVQGNGTAAGNGVGTILTDDPIARVSISDLALAEGDSGTTSFEFAVTLSEVLDNALDIGYVTADITAAAGADYTAATSSISIPAGTSQGTIEVFVNGDTDTEDDEVFEVTISASAPDAEIVDGSGLGTILNDDGSGGWTGAESVHLGSSFGAPQSATRPQVGFGPGGERHVVFLQGSRAWHTVSPARDVWSTPIEIGSVSTSFHSPRLAVDSSGRAVVALTDTYLTGYSYNPATDWQLEALPQAVEVLAEIEMTGDPISGETIAVWRVPASNALDAWSSRFEPGLGWQDTGLVETTDDSVGKLHLAQSANGSTIAVLPQPATGNSLIADIAAYHLQGANWVGPLVVDDLDTESASFPRIDINANGDAAAVWQQETPVNSGNAVPSVYISFYDAVSGQWSDAELVEDEVDFSAVRPDVAVDADGNVFVIWLQDSQDYSTRDLYANRYDAAAQDWSGPHLLELDDTAASFAAIDSHQVVADDLGNAIVVWTQDDGVQRNIRSARYSAADVDWLPAELLEEIDTGDANIPELVIDRSSGDAMVVWHQNNGSTAVIDIWANRYVN